MGHSPALRRAFLATGYGLPGERFRLGREGPTSPPSWSAQGGAWSVLTAWNPAGQRADRHDNAARQVELTARLREAGFFPLLAVNGEGGWAEAALIVPDLRLRAALNLGRDFGQAAVLWGVGRRVALVWCQPARVERWWVVWSAP